VAALGVVILLAPLAACGTAATVDNAVRPTDPIVTPLPSFSTNVRAARGQIVESHALTGMSQTLTTSGAHGYYMVYRTASGIDGGAREVSGTVFVPTGTPPAGGWPIVSYAHGTTGITPDCGPSGYPDLLGYDQVVVSLLTLGFVVTSTDYEGLGHPGRHPYLEPKTAAIDVIDAVRAARNLVPQTSTRWFADGVSQGGEAAWAADEFADEYGDGLQFGGAAALSPASDLSGMAALAQSRWLSPAQQIILPMLVTGLTVTDPSLKTTDYLHGPLSRDQAMWLACTGAGVRERVDAAATLSGADSEPSSNAAADRLRRALAMVAVPQRRASGPLIVVTGDHDDVVGLPWVRKSVQAACALGDTVQFIVDPGAGHGDPQGGNYIGTWLLDRKAGRQATNTCANR
jgi:hypothetical protein